MIPMNQNYFLTQNSYTGELAYVDYQKIKGYNIIPKNDLEYDGIVVNKMVLVKPTLIEKMLKRKTKRKLNMFLQYLINLIDSEEDEDTTKILDELAKFRGMLAIKYSRYLDSKYIELLEKKLVLLEYELKSKQYDVYVNEDVKEEKRTR